MKASFSLCLLLIYSFGPRGSGAQCNYGGPRKDCGEIVFVIMIEKVMSSLLIYQVTWALISSSVKLKAAVGILLMYVIV